MFEYKAATQSQLESHMSHVDHISNTPSPNDDSAPAADSKKPRRKLIASVDDDDHATKRLNQSSHQTSTVPDLRSIESSRDRFFAPRPPSSTFTSQSPLQLIATLLLSPLLIITTFLIVIYETHIRLVRKMMHCVARPMPFTPLAMQCRYITECLIWSAFPAAISIMMILWEFLGVYGIYWSIFAFVFALVGRIVRARASITVNSYIVAVLSLEAVAGLYTTGMSETDFLKSAHLQPLLGEENSLRNIRPTSVIEDAFDPILRWFRK